MANIKTQSPTEFRNQYSKGFEERGRGSTLPTVQTVGLEA